LQAKNNVINPIAAKSFVVVFMLLFFIGSCCYWQGVKKAFSFFVIIVSGVQWIDTDCAD
jgi:hypothetical protein